MQGFSKKESIDQIVKDLRLDGSKDNILAALSDVWDSYSDKALIFPRLQDLYTRRQVADNIRSGDSAWSIDWEQAGVKESGGDVFKHYTEMWGSYNSEIIRLEGRAAASAAPVGMAQMTATAPRMPSGTQPDPNNPLYRGDPLIRPRGRY